MHTFGTLRKRATVSPLTTLGIFGWEIGEQASEAEMRLGWVGSYTLVWELAPLNIPNLLLRCEKR